VPRVSRRLIDPNNPQSLVDAVEELQLAIEHLEFGNPNDPYDPSSGFLAGSAASGVASHPGELVNMHGAWCERDITTLDYPYIFYHNLNLPVPMTGEPNVCWTVKRWEHSGATKTQFEDLRVPMNAIRVGPARPPTFAAGPVAPFNTIPIWWFAYQAVAGNEEQMYFAVQLPHSWKEGTQLYPHIHWTPHLSAGAANLCVKWGLEYSWANVGTTFPGTTTIYTDATDDSTQTEQAEQLVQNRHYLSRFEVDNLGAPATIDSTGQTLSSMLVCRVFRNSSHADDDHVTAAAGLLEVDFHYEVDGFGSDIEHSKTADVELEWTPWNVRFQTGDTVTANSIELRFYAAPGMNLGQNDPLKVTLWFDPAVRRP
jgi:hypothetical protein